MLVVLLAFLRLGCMSFGGPAAHLAYFRHEFVERRGWLTDGQFAQCISITQLLPGPSSSQTGMLIGLIRAGWPGAAGAWIGFTLPSAALMTAFGLYSPHMRTSQGWLHGLLVVAVAIVAQAVVTMRRALISNLAQLLLAMATCAAMLLLRSAATAPLAIVVCAAAGLGLASPRIASQEALPVRVSRTAAMIAALLFAGIFAALAVCARVWHDPLVTLASRLYAVGSLVFGGGHVVLPLLQSTIVNSGMASAQRMIAGYAAVQAMPGPLFTLSSYVGSMVYNGSLGVAGAVVATLAIFLPSFFLLAAVIPFYVQLARNRRFVSALAGANAGVVGLLAAAFVSPVWTNAIHTWADALFAAAAFALLALVRVPPWIVVICGATAGALLL
ncbi:MAG TPA: chromate efflux transporter [Candidatus Baltobacteraceae bacterium]|jgi:chromate transporter|nr:chromate efflux transporter [Candidatus Baltobacteraceae bacterium]